MKNKRTYFIYFAGDLFNAKDLLGNAAMADAIFRVSNGKYKCILPQDLVQDKARPKDIRDSDILNLLSADIAIFNFDGSELDSGTVVEYMFAKFADIPALQLRTDFRNGGDCVNENSDTVYPPWNLMASFYPRSEVLLLNTAQYYALVDEKDSFKRMMCVIENMANKIVPVLDNLLKTKPVMQKKSKQVIYDWLATMPSLNPKTKTKLKRILSKK